MTAIEHVEDIYALSPLQEGLLFHALEGVPSEAYFQQVTCELVGRLDRVAYRWAWEQVLERHPVLRSAFVGEEVERPVQVVLREVELPFAEYDLRALPATARRRALDRWRQADRRAGFDLATPPLMRLALLRTEAERWTMVWSHHHLLLDGWSAGLVVQEVVAAYAARCAGRRWQPSRPRPYRDYIAWLERREPAAADAVWRRELAGFRETVRLEPDRPGRRSGATAERGERQIRLSQADTERLRQAARAGGLTLNTLIHGSWALLLARWSGRRDVVFGVVSSGRPAELAGVERMVGLFINTLPSRVAVPDDVPAGEWLAALQARQAELRQVEHTPLRRVQRLAEIVPGQPLFTTILDFVSYPEAPAAPAGDGPDELEIQDFRVSESTPFDVALVAAPGERLMLRAYHDPARFSPALVDRLLRHLAAAALALAEDPRRPLGRVETLSAGELEELTRWGSARPEEWLAPPPGDSLHGRFARAAAARPDAVAVVCAEVHLTYGELTRRAAELAGRLRSAGAGPGDRVALFLDRSVEMATAMLGTLASGAAYVPLDPRYPRRRIEMLLADCGARVLLTSGSTRPASLPAGLAVLDVVEIGDPGAAPPADLPAAGSEAAAYVIYTSGSTGRPKGVEVGHDNVLRLFDATDPWFRFDARQVWSLFHSFSFDFSVWEMWGALLFGGRLVVVPYWDSRSPEAFHALLLRERVTMLSQTPSAFHTLDAVDREAGDRLALTHVVFGGEALEPESLRGWFQRHGDRVPRLVNMYGITETTVHVTYRPLSWRDLEGEERSPIGVAIPDLSLHVLDRAGRLVPPGVPGELFVGGGGVARGYVGRPALTADRFVPDPFARRPGMRLYRTGDLVRWRGGGSIDYLGRVDQQVKIRGFRIELGEIEAALLAHPALAAAVVDADRAGPTTRLAAYVVARQGEAPPAEELRRWVSDRLPEHMVPAFFVPLTRLPLTPSGKLDRRALPAPRSAGGAAGEAVPATAEERTLADIWRAVLGVEEVDLDNDFFALGGDSILSIQVVSRARQEGMVLTPRDVFEAPTVAALAGRAREAARSREGAGSAAAAAAGPLPLTPIQRWFLEGGGTGSPVAAHHFNQGVLLTVPGGRPTADWRAVVARLLCHHDALRLRFERGEDGWRQRLVAAGGAVPLAEVDLAALPAERLAGAVEAAAAAAQRSLDLGHGPLLRALLLRRPRGGGERAADRLALVVHHLAVDAVSWRVLLEDLDLLLAAADPAAARLPPPGATFQEHARRLAAWAGAPEAAAEAERWLECLSGGFDRLPLAPGDDPVGAESEAVFELPPAETEALLGPAPTAFRASVEEMLLAAVARGLAAWSGGRRVLVDLERHGRDTAGHGGSALAAPAELDLSRTVGWFTSLFPVALDLVAAGETSAADGGPGTLLDMVKERLRGLPSRGLSFGVLRWLAAAPVRERLAAVPAAELAFNYLGRLDRGLSPSPRLEQAPERLGGWQDRRQRRSHTVVLEAAVSGGRLRLRVVHGRRLDDAAARALADAVGGALSGLVAHSMEPGAGGCSASDFPLATLDPAELDGLARRRGGAPGAWIEDLYPLSAMQEGMLFHSLHSPGEGLYVQHLVCRLIGDVDQGAFAGAWRDLLTAHPVLRTSFHWRGLRAPVQVVEQQVDPPLAIEDWRGIAPAARAARWEEVLEGDRREGFDLERAPLLHVRLVREGERSWRLAWAHHHILLDGWSRAQLIHELLTAYAARRRGRVARLPRRVPFRDHVAWLQAQDRAEAELFWRRELAGFTDPVELPAADGVPAGGGSHRVHVESLDPAATAGVVRLARRLGLTLNVLIQGLWALVLGRWAGRDDVVFGTIVSGRGEEPAQGAAVIGLLMNVQPVRARLDPGRPLAEWLAEFQQRQSQARRHQHVPLVEVQGWSEVEGGSPLFDTLFVFENFPIGGDGDAIDTGLSIEEPEGEGSVSYPLALVVEPGERLGLRVRHDRRRVSSHRVELLLAELAELAAASVADPSARLGELTAVAAPPPPALSAFNESLEEL